MTTLKNIPGDIRVVSESDYRAEVKKERLAAKELASQLAGELGIDQQTAAACAVALERPLLIDDETELPGSHCWTPEARRQHFIEMVARLESKQSK